MSDAQHRTLVRKAIAHAETVAADDDAAFVRPLRTHFFTRHAQRARALRVVAGGSRRGPAAHPSFHIFQDPRFLRNVRDLARRTQRGVRVIGGATVKAKDFLDCVAMGNDQQWGCTGPLVARNVVLTAGHCASFATRVLFGDVSKTGTAVRVRRRVRHPDAPVVGFGNTDPSGTFGYGVKRQTDVPIASPACDGEVEGEEDRVVYACDPSLELIAGKPLLARDTCSGTAAAPSTWPTDLARAPRGRDLAGPDSATNNCGDGGVYVRVDRYRDWIESIPGVDLPC